MLSSIVISQLIDETKSKENGATLPLPRAITQPRACPTKSSVANCGRVNLHRALAILPDRLGIPAPSDDRGPETEPPPTGANPGGSRRGFASITITARRVVPPASALVWGTVGDSLCSKCRAENALLQGPPALAGGAHQRQHRGPFACAEFPRNGSMVRLKFPEVHTRLCAGHEYWVTHMDDKEDRFSPGSPPSGKGPLVFSSCVHLQVSRQCPNDIYCLDKSLSVPVERPRMASPKVHRSVLSLNLSCSSHGLTADGVDGIANREPMSQALTRELSEGNQSLLGPPWSPALQDSHLKENPLLGRVHSGTGTCPWSGSYLLENREFADVGANQVTVRKEKEDQAARRTSGHANQLSIHIPGWSYRAVEAKVFSGSSQEQHGEVCATLSGPPLERKPFKHFPPDGDSSPSDESQSRHLSEPTESQRPSFLSPRAPLPGFLCPLQGSRTSPQEDSGVQIESEFPKGDYTCCDLVVKIKGCKKGEDAATAEPSPVPPGGSQTPAQMEDGPEPQQTPSSSMTLQEALEVRKPQFISRSQERLKKLEHKVQQRKAQQKENRGQRQSVPPARAKKQFTVPHPLSDNLFKPKERCISEKEMHMRSKRIYNNLPEVKKKKEEQKKRVILQSNRLRAEVFKKQLLDQLLQRNAV